MSDGSIKKRPGIFARIRDLEREVHSSRGHRLRCIIDAVDVKTAVSLANNKRNRILIDKLDEELSNLNAKMRFNFAALIMIIACVLYKFIISA